MPHQSIEPTQILDYAGKSTPRPPSFVARLATRLLAFRELLLVAIIAAACLGMAFHPERFLTTGSILAILLNVSVAAIIGIGMTVLLVSGGFDLSVGSTFAMTGAVTGLLMVKYGLPVPIAILLGLAVAALIGLFNGLIVAKVGINPFITTLAMMGIVRGAMQVITDGKDVVGLPKSFNVIGQGKILGVQHPILISLALVLLGDLLLRKTRFFRQNYYIGGNEKAATLSGIPVNQIKIFNYVLTAALAGLAGIISTARFGAAALTAGADLELNVITGVIIGGASLKGGEGTVLGSFLGILLMGIVTPALNHLGVDVYWQMLATGAILLTAVLIDTLSRRRRS